MTGKTISQALRRQVLTEAGYRCAVPTCRNILALDLHHIVEVQEGGDDTVANLIALCPTCHALYTRGTISKDAMYAYKSILVALSASFDMEGINNLLFLAKSTPRRNLIISGDGVLKFSALIAAGYADYALIANNGNQLVTYMVILTGKGMMLVNAWSLATVRMSKQSSKGRRHRSRSRKFAWCYGCPCTHVRVHDQGPGVAREVRPRLFVRFVLDLRSSEGSRKRWTPSSAGRGTSGRRRRAGRGTATGPSGCRPPRVRWRSRCRRSGYSSSNRARGVFGGDGTTACIAPIPRR